MIPAEDRDARNAGSVSDRALVRAAVEILALRGAAQWVLLDDGDLALRLTSGEIYRFGEEALTRIG